MSSGKQATPLQSAVLCGFFAVLIAAGAYIKIPVPIVPFTLQTAFVSLAGLMLGAKFGAIAAAVYAVVGLLGIPVFTLGGGVGYILQPTFGYIVGFIGGAFLTGKISHSKARPSYLRCLSACLAGLGVIYIIGIIYFWAIKSFYIGTEIGFYTLILYCFLLTIPGDIATSLAAAAVGKRLIGKV